MREPDIDWEDREGFRYWFVRGLDGQNRGFWDEDEAMAFARFVDEKRKSSNVDE